MAWDFETDPEFAEKLSWMRDFIDTEVIPLEPILSRSPPAEWQRSSATCRPRSRRRGCGGCSSIPAWAARDWGSSSSR